MASPPDDTILHLFDMDSPRANINEIQPESPLANYPGLDDFASDATCFYETMEQQVVCSDVVNQHVEIPDLNQAPRREHRKELTGSERRAAYEMLLVKSVNGVLKRHATKDVADCFGVGIRTIQRLWKRAKESDNHDYSSLRVENCGRKRVDFDMERIRTIPLRQRTTLRSLAFALGVSMSSLHAKLKAGVIKRHTNAIKPTLTADNLTSRLNFCLSSLDPETLPRDPTFYRMYNTVHIDEKWFYLTKRSQTYYLLHDEIDPVRTIKNSHFIPKIMFLAAVARPRFDSNSVCTFDGKIGIFPLVETVAAIRSSHNRPRGTLEVKPIANITRAVIREFMITKVIPAIASKWPAQSIRDEIFIQQDNAKTHIQSDDVDFLCAVQESGLNMTLFSQPPNSPDLNVLDLGFFRAIQSLQAKDCAKSTDELIAAVEEAYEAFSIKKSNHIFLTLQSCMIEILKCQGSNIYKIPHMKKEQLERQGILPETLRCSPERQGIVQIPLLTFIEQQFPCLSQDKLNKQKNNFT